MRQLRAPWSTGALRGALLLLSVLCLAACDRSDNHDTPSSQTAPTGQALSVQSPTELTATSSTEPGPVSLQAFQKALEDRLTPNAQGQELPEGGVLYLPEGHVTHAAVIVRQANGSFRTHCVSSPAEVQPLVQQMQAGVPQ